MIWHLNCVQTNDLSQIDLLEIELIYNLTVCNDYLLTELLLIYSNTWKKKLIQCKKWARIRLKTLQTKWVYKSQISNICVSRIWHEIT